MNSVPLPAKQTSVNIKKAEKISKALADPNRLQILKEIRKKEECLYCSDLQDMIDLAQPSISHHLKQLTDTELVVAEKEGRNVKYSLNNKVLDDYIEFLESLKRA
jgi:ArsR family transcriptional regulator, arsenate/arsenite/antimonite-responsive transcriptional repressor